MPLEEIVVGNIGIATSTNISGTKSISIASAADLSGASETDLTSIAATNTIAVQEVDVIQSTRMCDLSFTATPKLARAVKVNEGINKPYLSLERVSSYLYKITFDKLSPRIDITTTVPGGCTSFIRNGMLHRNLDWTYDNAAEFIVNFKDVIGMSFISGLEDGHLNGQDALLSQLPYHINDGVNNSGLMVSTHVLFNDFNWHGAGARDKPITLLPFLVLTTMVDINKLSDEVNDLLANHYIPTAMGDMLMQVLVSDGMTTKLFTPTDYGYVYVDITSCPKLANFKWINKSIIDIKIDERLLQLRPTGIERWNMVNDEVTLENLKFTNAYETDSRLSEFIGIRDTTKYSTTEELKSIYESARALYLKRKRNGELWQTLHSVIYSSSGMESLFVQENYNKDHIISENSQGNPGSGDIIVKHNQLHNLDYEHSGHTGFQPRLQAGEGIQLQDNTISSMITAVDTTIDF